MNNFTERTWLGPMVDQGLQKVMKTYIQYPPRKLQSVGYSGPVTISNYQRFEWLRAATEEGRRALGAADGQLDRLQLSGLGDLPGPRIFSHAPKNRSSDRVLGYQSGQ